MADTLPDVQVPNTDWIDVFNATGIAVGTALTIQNKSSSEIIAFESATKPAYPATGDGVQVLPFSKCGEFYTLSSGSNGLWMTSLEWDNANVSIQGG